MARAEVGETRDRKSGTYKKVAEGRWEKVREGKGPVRDASGRDTTKMTPRAQQRQGAELAKRARIQKSASEGRAASKAGIQALKDKLAAGRANTAKAAEIRKTAKGPSADVKAKARAVDVARAGGKGPADTSDMDRYFKGLSERGKAGAAAGARHEASKKVTPETEKYVSGLGVRSGSKMRELQGRPTARDSARGKTDAMRDKLAAMKAKTAEHKKATSASKARTADMRSKLGEMPQRRIEDLKAKIKATESRTAKLDRGFAREDRKADRSRPSKFRSWAK